MNGADGVFNCTTSVSGRGADQRTTFAGNFIERFDYALPNPPAGQTPPPQWNAIVLGNYSETRSQTLSPTALPATTGKVSNGGGQAQAMYSRSPLPSST